MMESLTCTTLMTETVELLTMMQQMPSQPHTTQLEMEQLLMEAQTTKIMQITQIITGV